jgi:hypothetical protein
VIVHGSGDFTATVAPAPTTPLQLGGSAQGGGTAAFDITVGEDELLELRAVPDSAEDFLELLVIDAAGYVIDGASSFDAGEPASVILTSAGGDAQQVIVRGADGYTATLDRPLTTPLEPGDAAEANGTTVYDVDVGDEPVEFIARPDSDDGVVYVRVLDADGTLIDEGYPEDLGEPATVILTDLGGAHVVVQGHGGYTATLGS